MRKVGCRQPIGLPTIHWNAGNPLECRQPTGLPATHCIANVYWNAGNPLHCRQPTGLPATHCIANRLLECRQPTALPATDFIAGNRLLHVPIARGNMHKPCAPRLPSHQPALLSNNLTGRSPLLPLLQQEGVERVKEHLLSAAGEAACCMICLESIRPADPVWSCSSGCYAVMHLPCIQVCQPAGRSRSSCVA